MIFLRGIVHPQMNMLSSFTHSHDVPNLSSVEKQKKTFCKNVSVFFCQYYESQWSPEFEKKKSSKYLLDTSLEWYVGE